MSVRSVRRVPVERRWGIDRVKWAKWAPWHKYQGDDRADGEIPEGAVDEERESVKQLIRQVQEERKEGKTVVQTPVESSGSTGVVERGVQEIEGGMRVLLSVLQDQVGVKLSAKERNVAFIPEYAAYC